MGRAHLYEYFPTSKPTNQDRSMLGSGVTHCTQTVKTTLNVNACRSSHVLAGAVMLHQTRKSRGRRSSLDMESGVVILVVLLVHSSSNRCPRRRLCISGSQLTTFRFHVKLASNGNN